MPVTCQPASAVGATCKSATVAAATCKTATNVLSTAQTPFLYAPLLTLLDHLGATVSYDDIYTLYPGVYVFTIRNDGNQDLRLYEITSSDPTIVVSAPGSYVLAPGATTTFTVTVV
jgi:hypothetical protein